MPCLFPRYKTKKGFTHVVKCKVCDSCLAARRAGWKFRVKAALSADSSRTFVSLVLTYRDADLPPHGFYEYSDVQKYFKRIRKSFPSCFLKYLGVAHYGKKNKRPHYHIVLFLNKNEPLEKKLFCQRPMRVSSSTYLDTNNEFWYKGNVYLIKNSINYILNYFFSPADIRGMKELDPSLSDKRCKQKLFFSNSHGRLEYLLQKKYVSDYLSGNVCPASWRTSYVKDGISFFVDLSKLNSQKYLILSSLDKHSLAKFFNAIKSRSPDKPPLFQLSVEDFKKEVEYYSTRTKPK